MLFRSTDLFLSSHYWAAICLYYSLQGTSCIILSIPLLEAHFPQLFILPPSLPSPPPSPLSVPLRPRCSSLPCGPCASTRLPTIREVPCTPSLPPSLSLSLSLLPLRPPVSLRVCGQCLGPGQQPPAALVSGKAEGEEERCLYR